MKYVILMVLMCVALFAVADDLFVRIEIPGANGAKTIKFAKLEGWKVEQGTNGQWIATEVDVRDVINPVSTNMTVGTSNKPVKAVFCSSETFWLGEPGAAYVGIGAKNGGLDLKPAPGSKAYSAKTNAVGQIKAAAPSVPALWKAVSNLAVAVGVDIN